MLKTDKRSIGSSRKLKGQVKPKKIEVPKEKNGDLIECNIEGEVYELQIGEVYTFPVGKKSKSEKEGIFRGTYSESSSKAGFYYDKSLETFVQIVDAQDAPPEEESAVDVNLEMLGDPSEDDIKTRKTAVLSTGEKKKRSKQNRDDVLQFDIEPDNDIMVKLIKEKINKSSITSRDVMTKTPSGSNMIAGLRQRNSMTLQTFYIWCKILNCTPVISIKEN